MEPTIFDRFPHPPIARLPGWKLVRLDEQAGTIGVEFWAKDEFTNPSGFVQGGIIAAMLDDTISPACFALTGGKVMTTTIDLHVHYIRPVSPGPVTASGRVINRGNRVAFLAGELFDSEGRLAATAAASAILNDHPVG